MRTTLTLDPDVARQLEAAVTSRKTTLKAVVNDALRIGLEKSAPRKLPPFRVKAHPMTLRAGIDPNKLNQLVDELEAQDYLRKQRR